MLDEIRGLFEARGADAYLGEPIAQLEHALQCAWLAERACATSALVIAALLHDIGHLLHEHGGDCAERGLDARHEALGARFLGSRFGPEVTELVAHHVDAKRYLCATSPSYIATLSDASRLSLELQGGPMSARDAGRFVNQPFAADAVALRRWDDEAKVPGLVTPSLEHFLTLVPSHRGKARG